MTVIIHIGELGESRRQSPQTSGIRGMYGVSSIVILTWLSPSSCVNTYWMNPNSLGRVWDFRARCILQFSSFALFSPILANTRRDFHFPPVLSFTLYRGVVEKVGCRWALASNLPTCNMIR